MAIPFPDIIPSSVSFGIKNNTQVNVSPLSGSVQTIEVPGARWVATLSFDDLEPYEGRVLASFLAQLRGSSGRFLLYDHSHPVPRGTATTQTVTITTLASSGNTITTTWSGGDASGRLLPGDYIELPNNELKMVTNTVNVSGGQANIIFEPPLRDPVAATSPIILNECKAVMLLSENENRWGTNNPGLLTNISIDCIEGFA